MAAIWRNVHNVSNGINIVKMASAIISHPAKKYQYSVISASMWLKMKAKIMWYSAQ
jgi:hypothetical protein